MDKTFEEWYKKAAEAIDEAESDLKDLWGKARASVKGEASRGAGETVALEARPEGTKVLYARVLAAQCLIDGRLDPREVEYLYVFMSRVSLGADSREEVRRSLGAGECGPTTWCAWSRRSWPRPRATRKRSRSPSSRT